MESQSGTVGMMTETGRLTALANFRAKALRREEVSRGGAEGAEINC